MRRPGKDSGLTAFFGGDFSGGKVEYNFSILVSVIPTRSQL
jgi:hypothetical protein